MKEHSEALKDWNDLRAKIIGLGERSIRKSYYPELEQRLDELERFRALLDQSNDLIFLAKVPSGRFVDVNESACRQLGYPRETLLDMAVSDFLPEELQEKWAELLEEDQIDQEGKTHVTAFTCQKGEIPVEMSVRLVTFSGTVYAVLVARDITRRKEMEEQLRRQERLAAVGQLAAGIAHDFNNIMAAVVLYAQLMAQTEGLSTRNQEQLAAINDLAKQATSLIQQILDFSRQAVIERQPLDLLPLLREQSNLLKRTLPDNIQVELKHASEQYTVNADPTRMQQVLTNLAVNARDAMPDGGILRIGLAKIIIEAGQSPLLPQMPAGSWVRLTVSDTGEGIPADSVPHIFEPFFTTKGPGQGTGLGLAQVHGIIRQHQGRIGVETQVGEGTTFTIFLPALEARPSEIAPSMLADLTHGHGETILVVEDNVSTRRALVASLEDLSYEVVEVANGEEALQQLESATIALVLSDVVMPKMGGRALLRAMQEQRIDVPLILLTGHPLEQELADLQENGLNNWLPKPTSLPQLAAAVSQALIE